MATRTMVMSCACRLLVSLGYTIADFCSAGTGAASYKAVEKQATRLQVYAVELPGRGRRANETAVSRAWQRNTTGFSCGETL